MMYVWYSVNLSGAGLEKWCFLIPSCTYFNYSLTVPGPTLGKLFLIFSEAGNVDLISLLAATGIN